MKTNRRIETERYTFVEVEPNILTLKALCKIFNATILECVPNESPKDSKNLKNARVLVSKDSFDLCLKSSRHDLAIGKSRLIIFGISWRNEESICEFWRVNTYIPTIEFVFQMKLLAGEKKAYSHESVRIGNPLYGIADIDDITFRINIDLAGIDKELVGIDEN